MTAPAQAFKVGYEWTTTEGLLRHLHWLGNYANYWTKDPKRTYWFTAGEHPQELPQVNDVYFSVNPVCEIPTTDKDGKPAAPEDVRTRTAFINAINCLFAEFDRKDGATLEQIESLDPRPSVVYDSGGGWQCYWLLAKTFEIKSEQDRERAHLVQAAWVKHVGSDGGAKDLARVLRVPGTMNTKYDPPRPVQYIWANLDVMYEFEYLEGLLPRPQPKQAKTTNRQVNLGAGSDEAEAAAALGRLHTWRCDDYNAWLSVGMALTPLGNAGLILWDNWSKGSDKYQDDICARKWATFDDNGLGLGSLFYWANKDSPGSNGHTPTGTPPAPEDLPPAEGEAGPPKLSTWADIDGLLGPITWAWPGWLPIGMLTILAGESGAGKSALALRLAACFLSGELLPDKSRYTGELGAVLWCEAEAAQAINQERAKKWGLPLDRILTPLTNPLEDFRLENAAHWGAMCERAMLPEVRLIVIDSLRGAAGGDENSSETMQVVKKLAELARDSGKPLILTHHLRKRSIFDGDGVDLERLRGSGAIVQPARVVWALDVPDQTAKDWKRLQVVKSNLARFPEPVGMMIDETGVRFGLAPEKPRTETVADRAVDLLLALLQDTPLDANAIKSEFESAGMSIASMRRAKERLGVVSIKDKDGWKWGLPEKGENDYAN